MTWFKHLMGFEDSSPTYVRENCELKGDKLYSKINGKSYIYGSLDVPTLSQLRKRTPKIDTYTGEIKVQELVGDVQDLHLLKANDKAFFQAASQFNLLEMVSPNVTPEDGIGIYERDYTQGPACAIACGAGTIYRNYFAKVGEQIGQSDSKQLDCLDLLGSFLGNQDHSLWSMVNGYALATSDGLRIIEEYIKNASLQEYDYLKGLLKIGIQWNSQVTMEDSSNIVSQGYCAALPISYSKIPAKYWESFARLILEATYEATLYAAVQNMEHSGNNKVFLTLVGGGAFGNPLVWILDAISSALSTFSKVSLDVSIISYGRSNPKLLQCIEESMQK